MVSHEVTIWLEKILELINRRSINDAISIRLDWSKHCNFIEPVITIFGPWSTGKSSLLKRILVDDNRRIPKWLLIGADRTTYDVGEVKAYGCTFCDTPGIASSSDEHTIKALEQCLVSDFFVILLPKNQSSSNDEFKTIISLISGSYFYPEIKDPFIAKSIKLLVTRIDESGSDALDDIDDYRDFVRKKSDEYLNFFELQLIVDPKSRKDRIKWFLKVNKIKI